MLLCCLWTCQGSRASVFVAMGNMAPGSLFRIFTRTYSLASLLLPSCGSEGGAQNLNPVIATTFGFSGPELSLGGPTVNHPNVAKSENVKVGSNFACGIKSHVHACAPIPAFTHRRSHMLVYCSSKMGY